MDRRSPFRLGVVLALTMLASCALPEPTRSGERLVREPLAGRSLVTVECGASEAQCLPMVMEGLEEGLQLASRWGELISPVRVVLYSDSASLRQAVGRENLTYLQAWATDRDLAIVVPRGLDPVAYRQLLAHEITHVVHYQTARIPAKLTRWKDPFWFREGLAIYTARQQGYPTRQAVAGFLRESPSLNVLDPNNSELARHSALLYGTARELVEALVKDHGEAKIGQFLNALAASLSFDDAFSKTFGLTPEAHRQRVLRTVLGA